MERLTDTQLQAALTVLTALTSLSLARCSGVASGVVSAATAALPGLQKLDLSVRWLHARGGGVEVFTGGGVPKGGLPLNARPTPRLDGYKRKGKG
eukprot:352887-Chlamydomonas_euryale.AAC.1